MLLNLNLSLFNINSKAHGNFLKGSSSKTQDQKIEINEIKGKIIDLNQIIDSKDSDIRKLKENIALVSKERDDDPEIEIVTIVEKYEAKILHPKDSALAKRYHTVAYSDPWPCRTQGRAAKIGDYPDLLS